MEGFKALQSIAISAFILILISSIKSVNGQISTPCTFSMITNFTPCLNFITGSSNNGSSSPTRGCCSSLKSLMSSGMDCACLLISANVPFQLPINRTLAAFLPRACNLNGLSIQCKCTVSLFFFGNLFIACFVLVWCLSIPDIWPLWFFFFFFQLLVLLFPLQVQ